MNGDEDQRLYLQRVLAQTGWTQTQLAQRAGLDPSTLSRFLTGERQGHALRVSTLAKVAAASGVALAGQPPPTPPPEGLAEAEAAPLDIPEDDPLATIARSFAVPGRPMDPWKLASRALENAGYRPGDVLLVALDETPRPGDVVCAQVYDWAKGGARTIFRLYQPPYLVSATNSPDLMRPLSTGDGNVAIKGVVAYTIRGRPGTD